MPQVCVVVTSFNVATFLDGCLNSILGQTYERLEVVVESQCAGDSLWLATQLALVQPAGEARCLQPRSTSYQERE